MPALPDAGYPLDVPGVYELRGVLPPFQALADAASGLGHNLLRARSRRPAAPHDAVRPHAAPRRCRRSASRAALRVAGIRPQDVRLDGTRLRLRRSRDAAVVAPRQAPRTARRVICGGRSTSAAGAARRSEEPHLSDLLVLRSARTREEQILANAEADDRSGDLPRQDRVRRRHRVAGCSTSSRRRSRTARCPAFKSTPRSPTTSCRTASSRAGGRRVRVATVTAAGARRRPGRDRCCRRGGRRRSTRRARRGARAGSRRGCSPAATG